MLLGRQCRSNHSSSSQTALAIYFRFLCWIDPYIAHNRISWGHDWTSYIDCFMSRLAELAIQFAVCTECPQRRRWQYYSNISCQICWGAALVNTPPPRQTDRRSCLYLRSLWQQEGRGCWTAVSTVWQRSSEENWARATIWTRLPEPRPWTHRS